MIVMPANSRKGIIHYLAGKYPNKIGHLYNANDCDNPRFYLPYALDNGVYGAFTNKYEWDESKYFRAMEDYWNILGQKAKWILVPDKVACAETTFKRWDMYKDRLRDLGYKTLAFALQDGMTYKDIPKDADVCFIGGSTEFKWGCYKDVCKNYPRVHIGRVNMTKDLVLADKAGAESVDGTGFGRAPENIKRLTDYLDWCEGKWDYPEQKELQL